MPVASSWHAARLALTWPNRLVRCYRFCCARAMGEWSWHAAKLVLTELEGRFREAFSCCARWNEVASDPFPPLAKGVRGGWSGHDRSQGLPMLSPSQCFCIPLARREESVSISKARAPDCDLLWAAESRDELEVVLVIFLTEERLLSAVSPLGDMVGHARSYHTCQSSHGGKLTRPQLRGKS
jgi:hypothetical protein